MDWGYPDGPLGPGIGFLAVMVVFFVIKNTIGARLDRWERKQDQRREEESRQKNAEYWAGYYRKHGKAETKGTNKPTT